MPSPKRPPFEIQAAESMDAPTTGKNKDSVAEKLEELLIQRIEDALDHEREIIAEKLREQFEDGLAERVEELLEARKDSIEERIREQMQVQS